MKHLLIPGMIWLIAGACLNAAERPIEFNRDIRPILSENCFACHGPDSGARKAGLRLDIEEGAKGRGKGDPAIVAGKAEASEVYKRLVSHDAKELMPPAKSNKKLDSQQKQLIRDWINQGAKWEGHWAFIPLKKPAIPDIGRFPGVVRNPIDFFVFAKLQEQGMKPSPEADRVTLIRRLSFDLNGLPPTPEEVRAFVEDKSDNAYQKLVDKLLASSHYGERMAVFWLDLVRYADSVGYHGDQPVTVWPYRDWVINAFNKNMPFDRFTLEQIAGDLLPNPTIEQKVASGYNRLGMMSAEGGVQDREYLAKYAAERVRNIGGAWMGSTFGCAECHDHKFDPFTMKDFYSMEAFFADITEKGLYGGSDFGPRMTIPDARQKADLDSFDAGIAAIKKKLDTQTPDLDREQVAWESSLKETPKWTIVKPSKAISKGGAKLEILGDGAVLVSGKKPDKDTYTLTMKLPKGSFTAMRLEALPHASLPAGGSGRAGNGNFVLSEWKVIGPAGPVAFTEPSATFEQTIAIEGNPFKKWTPLAAIDGNARGENWGWAILPEVKKSQHAVFQLQDALAGESTLTLTLDQNHGHGNHTLGHFRIAITDAKKPVKAGDGPSLSADVLAILAVDPAKRNDAQKQKLAAYHRGLAKSLEKDRNELAQIQAKRDALEKSLPTTLVTISRAPRTIKVLARGNWMDDTGAVVLPATPSFIPSGNGIAKPRLDRVDLANWMVSRENPLVARVLVNRLWKIGFGQGLSRKLEDVGSQGEWPSHPELLEWLASQLYEDGWDLKKTMKRMVMSSTYRQASVPSPEALAKDPSNRYLGRQGRQRIEAEFIRDTYLSVSGLLVDRQGGASVKPFQPRGYWAHLNFPTREWQKDAGESIYRRGLYTHWQRQYLHPAMLAFDASCREECAADRVRSNTPLQALALLNDPSAVEAARVFAQKILKEGGNADSTRIEFAFQRALSRAPRAKEKEVLLALLKSSRESLEKDSAAVRELLLVGDRSADKDLPAVELASWACVARALFNLHETITRN